MRLLLRLTTLLGLGALVTAAAPAPYHSLTREFAQFVDETANLSEAERVAQFKLRFNQLFPGFYEPAERQSPEQFDRRIARALAEFPALRPRYEQVERDFPAAYAGGIKHFRAHFPGFKPVLPVWFIHSLGRMDGGTRDVRGQTYLIFGADEIARIYDGRDIGPFLDHELFHVENGRWFKDCDQLWCGLWQEGLATYAASVMNPDASDATLMLDQPKPIRAAVDADWAGALCETRHDLDATDRLVYGNYFFVDGRHGKYPARWGYYVGYRVMQQLGTKHSLAALNRLDHARARPLLQSALDTMIREAGGCPAQVTP